MQTYVERHHTEPIPQTSAGQKGTYFADNRPASLMRLKTIQFSGRGKSNKKKTAKKPRKKFGVQIAYSKTNKNVIENVNITHRPAFTMSTRKTLGKAYPNMHASPTTVKSGNSRNHIIPWLSIKHMIADELRNKKNSEVNQTLDNLLNRFKITPHTAYKNTKNPLARIKSAARLLFNNVGNLRVGDSSQNSSDGSKMKHRLNNFQTTYPTAQNNEEKYKIWTASKTSIKDVAYDPSPKRKSGINRTATDNLASPAVKGSMNAMIGYQGTQTPPSARKGKPKKKNKGKATKIVFQPDNNSDTDEDSSSSSY